MKRVIALLLALLMLTSCGGPAVEEQNGETEDKVQEGTGEVKGPEVALSDKSLEFLEERTIPVKRPEYKPIEINPQLRAYSVDNLNEVKFADSYKFNEKEKAKLKENLFFARRFKLNREIEYLQPFTIYDENYYNDMPSFVTTDSIFHAYHIFYDFSLRTLEEEKLFDIAYDSTEKLLSKSLEIYNSVKDDKAKELALRNVKYFAVPYSLLGGTLNIPDQALADVNKVLADIEAGGGMVANPINGYEMDYSQFTVRGHYTRSEKLGKYFKAFMWYGNFGMPLYEREDDQGKKERDEDSTMQAVMISDLLLKDKELMSFWQKMYEPTVFYVGKSDDLTVYDYSRLIYESYGADLNYEGLANKESLDKFYKLADSLPEPQIDNSMETGNLPKGKQFRYMGQRYTIDADVMQKLTEPIIRPIPSGLDVAAALGSDLATEIQLANPDNTSWGDYEKKLKDEKKRIEGFTDDRWKENLYTGWLWAIRGYFKEYGEGYPSFMQNRAWTAKDLNSGLGAYAELKHDTILYGKQVGAQMGGDEYVLVKGYVEPNLEVYQKLKWLTDYSLLMLKDLDILTDFSEEAGNAMATVLEKLITISEKELSGEVLSQEEYDYINYYGSILERLMSRSANVYHWFEIENVTDKRMPVIADVGTIKDRETNNLYFLEVAVENPYEIFVVVEIEGELVLTRGAIFNYQEFLSGERLTDEKWQEIIKQGMQPDPLEFTSSYLVY